MGFFSTKPISQSKNSLGRLLRNTRMKHKVKINHVAQFTNIKPSYIEAIENDQWHQLPSLSYAKNFIITYAKFLELDTQKIANRFDIETNHSTQTDTPPESKPNKKLIVTSKTLIQILALTIIIAIGIFTYLQINHFSQIPKLDISEPADFTQVAVNKIEIKGQTDPENLIYINDQSLTTDKNGNFSAPVQLQSGYNIVKITAENKIGRSITATKVIVANLNNDDNFSTINLQVTALESDIWIRIKDVNGDTIYDGAIESGTDKSWQDQNSIFLTTTNAAQTAININGKDIGILGEEGEIIEDLQISSSPSANNL